LIVKTIIELEIDDTNPKLEQIPRILKAKLNRHISEFAYNYNIKVKELKVIKI